MQSANYLSIQFRDDQLMVGIPVDLLECRVIRLWQRLLVSLALAPQLIVRKQMYDLRQIRTDCSPNGKIFAHSLRSCWVSSAYSGCRRMNAAA